MLNLKKLLKHTRFFISAFTDKELTLFAASLSYYTIFTIIPLLLIMLTLLTSLPSFAEYYETIKVFIFSNLMPVNSEAIMGHIDKFLANSAKMGIIGLVMIIVASLLFFENFEYIANKIFHAKPRALWQSVTTYWTLMTLTPIALGVSFFISAKLAIVIESSSITSGIKILPIVPYIIIWALFFLIYQIGPNTKVNAKASLISSFIISIVFSISKNAFIEYVFYNKSYTTMYGSFAILMFLFLWIYVSWIIFIYGLKLCYMIDRIYKKREIKSE
ncbi:MAG: YihY family inner membrane protein [Sulfurimonas sp.]|uniref:YihY family inner membrane protein n=1 Tax=Sulfurimonas sp. TaxID=2022749 RepID=UPI00262FC908|nr:YihY family inner membrane protein [Sulfurimonas sp.]MCW8894702.1 YihY family inner membrane protein [Sulfurimonas sp.]MCW8955109.1 YihY family inner membrane protein [Sulfurimonas sp.]MCW9067122.1 YihY family inner membrane protein [Sulfurimonas sp.]